MNKKIIFLALLLQLFINSTTRQIKGYNTLAEENFNDLNDDGWIRQHESGTTDYSSEWKFPNGMYGLKINTNSIVENSFWGENSWEDYQVSFDMLPISGADKNFILRYQDRSALNTYNRWYEIHVSGSSIHLSKHGYGDITPAKNITITNGVLYNWKATLKNTRIKIEYKKHYEETYQTVFDVEDSSNNPILNGKIGIRIGTGAVYPTEIYFDNIVITDLSDSILDINHLSQKDPAWSDETYDHAPAWAKPESIGIKNWGCALTSASMVLNYYGFQNDPKMLNQYLIDQNGYTSWGGVIWSYFTKFARQAKDNDPTLADTKLLEFSYPEFDTNTLDQDLATKQPSIIKLLINPEAESHHFLVAGGKNSQTQDILAFDPGRLLTTPISVEQTYSDKEKLRLARFTPSNTDLSYLWTYGENSLTKLELTDDLGLPLSESQNFHEGGIQDNQSNDVSPAYKTSFLAKPGDGNYHLTFTGDKPGIHTIEIAAFDSVANDQHQVFHLYSHPEIDRKILITFDKSRAQNTQFKPETSFEIIRSLIEYGRAQSEISSWGNKHFTHMINQIEKLVLKQNLNAANNIKNATIHQVHTAFIEDQITQELRNALVYELQLLNFEK